MGSGGVSGVVELWFALADLRLRHVIRSSFAKATARQVKRSNVASLRKVTWTRSSGEAKGEVRIMVASGSEEPTARRES
jgi:hypothetical protein